MTPQHSVYSSEGTMTILLCALPLTDRMLENIKGLRHCSSVSVHVIPMACPVAAEERSIKSSLDEHSSVLQNSLTQSSKDYRTITRHQAEDLVTPSPPDVTRKWCYCQKGNACEQITYMCCLSTASYLGVLCRIYLLELSMWDGVPLFTSLYSQMVGTVIMGFTVSHRGALAENHSFIYQAITTGLCGSITTFSFWNLEAVSALLQTYQVPSDNAARVFGWGTMLLLGLGMPTGALLVGKHLASLSPWSDQRIKNRQPIATAAADSPAAQDSPSKCCHVGLRSSVFVSMSVWLAMSVLVVVLSFTVIHRLDLLFSVIFASLGTYCRWHLAPLNASLLNFKLGTFLVNVVGAWLLGGVVSVQEICPDGWVHDLLVGLGNGFCGCVTTVSTFVVELSDMPLRSAYSYAIISIFAAQVGLILIRGPVQWTSQ